MRDWLQPHRVVLIGLAAALVLACAWFLRWDWLAEPKYQLLIVQGIWRTLWILVVTMVIGMLLAVPLGLAQAAAVVLMLWAQLVLMQQAAQAAQV